MRKVFVAGAGKTRFGAFADKDLRTLAVEAGTKALTDAGVEPRAIEAFYLGNFAGPQFTSQNHLAPYISMELGIHGVPSTRMEDACASGSAALFQAYLAVASGIYETVLVLGVEKMTSQSTARVTEILAGAGDSAGEMMAGSTFPSLFAMIARRHMHVFGTTRERISAVAVKNHANGAANPDAQMRKVITLEQAMNARMIAEPLNLYDCSLISDGAAAVVLSSRLGAVCIRGIAQASDWVALEKKQDITTFPAVREAGRKAYAIAGVAANDIQFAELHDCFTIAEIVAMEDLGFAPRGRGGVGPMPINLSGGLKSKGHPVGATGVAQICDVVQQLRSGGLFAGACAEPWRQRRDLCGDDMRTGVTYTETVVHAAPERFAAEAPYQVAIVTLADGSRVTARVEGERVAIDDMVIEVESNGVPLFRKI